VQSSYPLPISGIRSREEGMKRLGTWSISDPNEIDITHAPLAHRGASIAHVALVYSALEGSGVQVVPSTITLFMALSSLLRGNYDSIFHLLKMFWMDGYFLQRFFAQAHARNGTWPDGQNLAAHETNGASACSLCVRQDGGVQTVLGQRKSLFGAQRSVAPDAINVVSMQLQNDVAMYICANNMREQIRNFVLGALQRLACRQDVSSIVINAHSNGSVIALDALRSLHPHSASKIKAIITAGSPLRKYATLFTWGQSLEMLHPIPVWKNFWDPHDFIADPLQPCFEWHRNKNPLPDQLTGLYWAVDPETGKKTPLPVEDIRVDNAAAIPYDHGLMVHNYWDNQKEFIPRLAACLSEVRQKDML
jgi:hypothetical protein